MCLLVIYIFFNKDDNGRENTFSSMEPLSEVSVAIMNSLKSMLPFPSRSKMLKICNRIAQMWPHQKSNHAYFGTFDQHIWNRIKMKIGFTKNCLLGPQILGPLRRTWPWNRDWSPVFIGEQIWFFIFCSRQKIIRCHLGTRHFSIWAITLESPIPLTNLNQKIKV